MANDLTLQSSALATPPAGSIVETYDTGSGHRQVVAGGAAGTKTFSDPAPTSSASQIVAASATRLCVIIENVGTVGVYLGSTSGVTTSTGLFLDAGETLTDDVTVDAWFAITASGTADLRVCVVA